MFWKKYKLRPVSSEELMDFRLSGKTGFLIKANEALYLARLKKSSTLPTRVLSPELSDPSLCETCDKVCNGCPMARDLTLSIQLGFGSSFPDAVKRYGRIEKYDFITSAVEIFNKKASNCIVEECTNYIKRNPADYEDQYFAETI